LGFPSLASLTYIYVKKYSDISRFPLRRQHQHSELPAAAQSAKGEATAPDGAAARAGVAAAQSSAAHPL